MPLSKTQITAPLMEVESKENGFNEIFACFLKP